MFMLRMKRPCAEGSREPAGGRRGLGEGEVGEEEGFAAPGASRLTKPPTPPRRMVWALHAPPGPLALPARIWSPCSRAGWDGRDAVHHHQQPLSPLLETGP